MQPAGAGDRAGFTLIELLVAMALFALISLAGFTLLSGIIGTRDRLDGRLAQVSQLQKAMYLITVDLESMTDAPLEISADALAFRRASSAAGQGSISVRYLLKDGAFHRETGGGGDQRIVQDVSAVTWRFLDAAGGWSETAQPSAQPGKTERPRAVEITLVLTGTRGGMAGPLRRVIELPRAP